MSEPKEVESGEGLLSDRPFRRVGQSELNYAYTSLWHREDELKASLLREKILRGLLRQLSNEVNGMIGFSEHELRQVLGNTNVAVLKQKVEADKAAVTGE